MESEKVDIEHGDPPPLDEDDAKHSKKHHSKKHSKSKEKKRHSEETDIENGDAAPEEEEEDAKHSKKHHHSKNHSKSKGKKEHSEKSDVEHGDPPPEESAKLPETTERIIVPKRLSDPLEPREGRDLVWKNVCMTLSSKEEGGGRKLLDNVFGEVPRGQVTAIMGPSGSGKTSLLNILAGRATSNGNINISADVRLNNYTVDPSNIEVRKKIAFVAQDDSLQVTATPREAIKFSARLRLPKSIASEEIDELTDQMLNELGLTKCADTVVGGALLKGLSGGERKRTSVGVELVTRPALVFLDEPTSGLDSFNAVQLCQLLGLVANAGSSVLFTIHQPSSDIFNAFDRLILLNAGRVMYQGSVKEVPAYFASCGSPVPQNYNPADWIMKVALTNSVNELEEAGFFPKDTRAIAESFTSDDKGNKDALGITDRSPKATDDNPPGVITQVNLLFLRELVNFRRATYVIKTRTAMTVMISLVSGCLFFQVAEQEFTSFIKVQSTFAALLMSLMANVFSTAIPSLTAFPEERPVFLREYSTNHYTVIAYFASRLTIELLVNGVQVSVSAILTYFMVGFSGSFGIFWAGLYLMACSSTALGVLVGSAVTNPSAAIEFLPAIFLPQILFSGFFIPPELMPNWLAWIRWICPLTYGVKIVVANEFEGRCDESSPPYPNFCNQVMENVEAEEDDIWWYFLVLLCLFIFFRLLALFVLKSKAKKFY